MRNFLLEIGTEELPARYVEAARRQVETIAQTLLSENRLAYEKIVAFASFRRIALLVEGLALRQEDIKTSVTGPVRKAAYNEKGEPTPAAMGFAKKQGIEVEDLVVVKKGDEERVVAERVEKGIDARKLLPEIIKKLILRIYFPKTMKWPQSDFRFARPVRWITAVFNNKTLKFNMGELQSGKNTFGHKFFASKPLQVVDVNKYEKILKDNYVIVDQDERKSTISRVVNNILNKKGFLLENNELLDEVNYLVEFPTPVLGKYDKKYLQLPQAVLVTCMKHHQKYFSVVDGNGKLLPCFVGVRDGISESMDNVRTGYEKVLTARLEDAEFFFRQDSRIKLEEYVERLKNVMFQQKTGTVFDKVVRIGNIAEYILNENDSPDLSNDSVLRAAYLCKADLMTQMVNEFPELQGVMGMEYAVRSGEKPEVAKAIYEHYMPLSADGKLPESMEGAVVSIADKLDSVCGDFYAGRIPTGSGDPYGLRRQAHGLLRIILEKNMNLSLDELVRKALESMKCSDLENIKGQIMRFLRQRIENVFETNGYRFDEIKSVLDTGYAFPVDALLRVAAVHKIRKLPDFEPIAVAFKRAGNILKQANENKIAFTGFNPDVLVEEEEKSLAGSLENIGLEVAGIIKNRDYEKALGKLVSLRVPVDRFFEKVMVMDKDTKLRDNRLALLDKIVSLFMKIADFSSITIDSGP
jgi:glycyl-tRNA synthetase beta chain